MCFLGMSELQGAYAALEVLSDDGWSIAIASHEFGIEISAGRGDRRFKIAGATVAAVTPFVVGWCRRDDVECVR